MVSIHNNTYLEIGWGPPSEGFDSVITAARSVYREYFNVHDDFQEQPLGVVVNLHTLKGQIIFADQPVLLPYEAFVPLEHLLRSQTPRPESEFDLPSTAGHSG